eukprot:Nk52_evm16s310 gene=Nk52_evmTU16s310
MLETSMRHHVLPIEEKLGELKSKYSLLEGDRRAYYETSQKAINDNKEIITSYRNQNKFMRNKLARLSKLYGTEKDAPEQGKRTNLEHKDEQIAQLRNKENMMRYLVGKKIAQLQALSVEYNKMIEDEKSLVTQELDERGNTSKMQQAQELRTLENRLDKAKIKYHEARSITSTYNKLKVQLSEEVLYYNNKIDSIQEIIHAQYMETESLRVMGNDAQAAKENAKTEFAATEQYLNEQRKHQEYMLNNMKQKVTEQLEIHDKIEKRQQKLLDTLEKGNENVFSAEDKLDKEQKIATYEEAMRKIKDATGVTDISEVVDKLLSQENTRVHLATLQEECERKIEELTKEKEKQLKINHDLKYSADAQGSNNVRIIDEFDETMQGAMTKVREGKTKAEKSVELCRTACAGIKHLAEKLEHVPLSKEPSAPNTNEAVFNLSVCDSKFVQLMEMVGEEEIKSTPGKSELPPYNVRIDFPLGVSGDKANEDEEEYHSDGEEVIDRESMKRQAAWFVDSKTKRKGHNRKQKRRFKKF